MEQRQLAKSELKLPVITFGAWAIGGWMWSGADEDDAVRAIQKAIDVGMNCIDTAPMYGMGRSERIVGKAIAGRRDEVIIATKCGMRWDREGGDYFFDVELPDGTTTKVYKCLHPESIREEIERSLKRLGIDVIDLYQCHWPDTTTPPEDFMGVLLDLKQQGKIRAIGVSNFSVDLIRQCLECGPVDANQPKYNMLDRDIEDGLLPFCIDHNIGTLSYSSICQGILTGKVTMDTEYEEGDTRASNPWYQPGPRRRVLDMLERIRPIADGHGMTLAQLAINWVISQKGITTALVGARNEQQVEQNAKAAEFKLADDELALIRKEVEALGRP